MRTDHCARCGYLVDYHDIAKRCPGLKSSEWKERDPIDGALWPELLARDVAARTRALEQAKRPYIPVTMPEPIVAARAPQGPQEFAGYHGLQAVGLGNRAAERGMDVAPFYWRSGTGVDGCAVKGYRPDWSFVATWERKPGKSWGFDVGYAWDRSGRGPVAVGYTALVGMIK
jgi:hypothetical protein